jgi:hypothetical protein
MTRRLKWGVPEPPPPKHPYRDTVLVYAGLAVVIVIVAWLTGGGVPRAAAVAFIFFVVASGWTIFRFHSKLRGQRADEQR